MPAIGSFENAPSEYDTAPTMRPSTYTGLPLIPAMTPVLASGPPSSLARMRLRLGPSTLRSTPMNWTLNSSMWSPSNTVRPTPIIPGRISSTGMRVGDADTVRMDNAASAKARTAGRQCMGKGPQLCRLVVGGLDNDYSGPRARGPAAANLRLDSLPEGLVA